jgi:hypothetical protein
MGLTWINQDEFFEPSLKTSSILDRNVAALSASA